MPDVVLLEFAVTALGLSCPVGAEPLQYQGPCERDSSKVTFRRRVEHRTSQYAAACIRCGLQPDS